MPKRITLNTKMASDGVLRVNWEGPYHVDMLIGSGAYMLMHIDRTIVKHP